MKTIDKYIPMTETAYYILLALKEEIHGYGIKCYIEKLTDGRLVLGAGTIYGTLSKMEKDDLIRAVNEYDRRKTYIRTDIGSKLLHLETERLSEMLHHAKRGGV